MNIPNAARIRIHVCTKRLPANHLVVLDDKECASRSEIGCVIYQSGENSGL